MGRGEVATRRGVGGWVVAAVGTVASALAWSVAAAGVAVARVEPPVNEGVPGEAAQVGVWLWIVLALVVVGLVGTLGWVRSLRRRTDRLDVYALVGRAMKASSTG